jgi:hypothetical protein
MVADLRGDAARNDRVEELLKLAEHLQTILEPVQPNASFRQRLGRDLDHDVRYRRQNPQPDLFQKYRTVILIGAAAVGSVASVLGVVVFYLLRQRQRGATQGFAG